MLVVTQNFKCRHRSQITLIICNWINSHLKVQYLGTGQVCQVMVKGGSSLKELQESMGLLILKMSKWAVKAWKTVAEVDTQPPKPSPRYPGAQTKKAKFSREQWPVCLPTTSDHNHLPSPSNLNGILWLQKSLKSTTSKFRRKGERLHTHRIRVYFHRVYECSRGSCTFCNKRKSWQLEATILAKVLENLDWTIRFLTTIQLFQEATDNVKSMKTSI